MLILILGFIFAAGLAQGGVTPTSPRGPLTTHQTFSPSHLPIDKADGIIKPSRSDAGGNKVLGWDLSYSSVLERNEVGRDQWLWKWLGQNYQSPAGKILAAYRQAPIQSAVLVEYPAFHAGEHTILLFIRTPSRAYLWQIVEGKLQKDNTPLNPELYDKAYQIISSWNQCKPLTPDATPPDGISGYSGFLSLYDRGRSRQMLLTLEDFILVDEKDPDKVSLGRLTEVLEPIINKE